MPAFVFAILAAVFGPATLASLDTSLGLGPRP